MTALATTTAAAAVASSEHSGLALAKQMDEDDARYASRLVDQQQAAQAVSLLANFSLDSRFAKTQQATSSSGEVRPVVVVLTDLRLFIVPRKPIRGRYVKFNVALVDLVEVSVTSRRSGHFATLVSFIEGHDKMRRAALVAQHALTAELATLLVTATTRLQLGRPARQQTRYHLPDGFLPASVRSWAPTWPDALAAAYRAQADLLHAVPNPAVVQRLARQVPEHLDVTRLLGTNRPHVVDVRVVALAVRHCPLITSLTMRDAPALGDDGVEACLCAFGPHSSIASVSLSGVGMGRAGCDALCAALDTHEGPVRLRTLSIYRARLPEVAVRALARSLSSTPMIDTLDLAACDLSSGAIASLLTASLAASLTTLNLSGSQAGRAGSLALQTFLERSTALRVLVLARANVHCRPVLAGIAQNARLPLRALNLTQNRLGRASCAALADVLARTTTLEDVVLGQVRAGATGLAVVVDGACRNAVLDDDKGFRIDLAGAVHVDAGKLLAVAQQQPQRERRLDRIRALDVSDCHLGLDGLAAVVQFACRLGRLETLAASRNVPRRLARFGRGPANLRDALAILVKTSTVTRLFLDGDERAALGGPVLQPMLEALALTRTLRVLSVAGNDLGEPALMALAAACKTNRGLVALHVDRNGAALACLRALADNVRFNDHLQVVDCGSDLGRLAKRHPGDVNDIAGQLRRRLLQNRRREAAYGPGRVPVANLLPIDSPANDVRFQRNGPVVRPRDDDENVDDDDAAVPNGPGVPAPQFGVSLDDCDCVHVGQYGRIPRVLVRLQRCLYEQGGLQAEGIFRVAPDAEAQSRMKVELDGGAAAPTATGPDAPHCLAGLMKVWFRSLPVKLLDPVASFRGAPTLDAVLEQLSASSSALLCWLIDVCAHVVDHQADNKMGSGALAIVWAPNLYDPRSTDPMEALRQSQDLAKSMEAWIDARRRLHPPPPMPNFAALLISDDHAAAAAVPPIDDNADDDDDADYGSISFDSKAIDSMAAAAPPVPILSRRTSLPADGLRPAPAPVSRPVSDHGDVDEVVGRRVPATSSPSDKRRFPLPPMPKRPVPARRLRSENAAQ